MPDFTVIEGGGEPRDWEREIAQQHFEDFVVVLLRTLASGDGSHQLTQQFFRFLEHAQENKVPIAPVFDGAISNLHAMAFATDDLPFYEIERKDITQAALRVIAESMATDNAARARRSKREQSLTQAIEQKILSSETRSRENGWSYVENLTKRLGKWPSRKK
jgi:hypothetical protein